jgi:hypothetical protein
MFQPPSDENTEEGDENGMSDKNKCIKNIRFYWSNKDVS